MPVSNDWIFEALRTMAERGVSDTEKREIGRLEAEVEHLRQRADRAERILAALREPSDKMVVTVFTAIFTRNLATKDVIRAAVAAAEQEVGR